MYEIIIVKSYIRATLRATHNLTRTGCCILTYFDCRFETSLSSFRRSVTVLYQPSRGLKWRVSSTFTFIHNVTDILRIFMQRVCLDWEDIYVYTDKTIHGFTNSMASYVLQKTTRARIFTIVLKFSYRKAFKCD